MAWFDLLKVVRKLSAEGEISAAAFAQRARIPTKLSSAWLTKFRKWGYVKLIDGPRPAGRGRPVLFYELTEKGAKRKAPTFKLPKLPKMVRGQKREE